MKPLTQLAHEAISKVLHAGDVAIDLTAGNGWDTRFLASCVGPTGHVYAFDIQTTAIHATRRLLVQHGLDFCITLENASHADWITKVPLEHRRKIKAAMMNLGYLPSGDKSIVTQASSTIIAIQSLLEWLQPNGVLTILAYTGHPGGQTEADAVQALLANLDSKIYAITQEPAKPAPQVPILYVVGTI